MWSRITSAVGSGTSQIVTDFHRAVDATKDLHDSVGTSAVTPMHLKMHALMQQGLNGKCNIAKPSVLDVIAKSRWQAWQDLGDLPQQEAMQQYIQLAQNANLLPKSVHTAADPNIGGGASGSQITSTDPTIYHNDSASLVDTAVSINQSVLTIQVNRMPQQNSWTLRTLDEINKTLAKAAKDESTTAVLLTGTGGYYSSGLDASVFTIPNLSNASIADRITGDIYNFVDSLIRFPKPLIAAVNGPAAGLAVSSLGVFDLVYCSHHSTFRHYPAEACVPPDACASVTMPAVLGHGLASDLFLRGRMFTAEQMAGRGLVNEVFEKSVFEDSVKSRVSDVVATDPRFRSHIQDVKGLIRGDSHLTKLVEANKRECEVLRKALLDPARREAIERLIRSSSFR